MYTLFKQNELSLLQIFFEHTGDEMTVTILETDNKATSSEKLVMSKEEARGCYRNAIREGYTLLQSN